MFKLIQPISKKDQVIAAIKEAILSGMIGPGDQIVESRMAQELGSGIPLVREALIALEHQGLVQKTPYKGTTVTVLEPLVVPLFAFFVMKTKREREAYIESAAMHGQIVEALAQESARELRALMKESLMGWKDDMMKLLFTENSRGQE